jgi:transposase
LSKHLKDQISRELDRLELLLKQIKAAEAERDALLAAQRVAAQTPAAPAAMLLDFNGIGPEFAAVLTWRNLSQGVKIRALAKLQCYGIQGLSPIA